MKQRWAGSFKHWPLSQRGRHVINSRRASKTLLRRDPTLTGCCDIGGRPMASNTDPSNASNFPGSSCRQLDSHHACRRGASQVARADASKDGANCVGRPTALRQRWPVCMMRARLCAQHRATSDCFVFPLRWSRRRRPTARKDCLACLRTPSPLRQGNTSPCYKLSPGR